jgi:hypothetical protein
LVGLATALLSLGALVLLAHIALRDTHSSDRPEILRALGELLHRRSDDRK